VSASVDGSLATSLLVRFLSAVLGSAVGMWLVVFGVCAGYLMHRNGFSAHSHPYLRPIVTSYLSCMVAAAELVNGDRTEFVGSGPTVAALAGPVVVIALSVVEVVRLRRLGVTLGDQPARD